MKIFQYCYDKTLVWAKHDKAPAYLGGMSFAESVFFPIPVDVMLAPMALAQPSRAWNFAFLATITSVLGGVLGYWLGFLMYADFIEPLIVSVGYQDKMAHAVSWFEQYGVWVVFLAGFSPIPYKVFTLSAGFLQMAFLPFLIASAVGRAMRFYLVAGLMKWGGEPMEAKLRQYIDWIGWALVAIVIVLFAWFKL